MLRQTVKGSHVIQAKEWVDAKLGNGVFRELTQRGGDRWGVLLPMAWYEVDILVEALSAAAKRVDVPLEECAAQIARLNAEQDLSSIYRLFLRIAQPQRVLDYTPRLWRTYVSFAEARAVRNDKGHYVGQGDGFDGGLIDWGCGCWRGFIPLAIEMSGGRDARGTITKRWKNSDGRYSLQLEVIYQ